MELKTRFSGYVPKDELFTLFPRTPVYAPDLWDTPLLRCYGYALQDKRLGDCTPGALPCCVEGLLPEGWFNDIMLRKVLCWDGLVETDFYPGKSQGHIIALAYGLEASYGDPDYHFYLYHPSEGFWSHKLGCARPVNTDHAGQIITDPRTAARGRLDRFVGYFALPLEGVPAFPRVSGVDLMQQDLARRDKEGYNPAPCLVLP